MSPLPHRKHSEFPGWEFSNSISLTFPMVKTRGSLPTLRTAAYCNPSPRGVLSLHPLCSAVSGRHTELKERQLRLRNVPFLNTRAICIFNTATKILPSNTVTKIVQTLLVYSIKFVFVLRVKINIHAV